MRSLLTIILTGAALLTASVPARAGLMGDSINDKFLFPNQTTVFADLGTQSVTPTAHFNEFNQTAADVTNSQIRITNITQNPPQPITFTPAVFNGFSFTDVTQD